MQKVQKWSNYIERLVIFCCVGIWLIGCSVAMGMMEKEKHIQQEIADKVIRFHVIANSDSQEDQQQKLEVRDAVVAALEPVLEGAESKEESRRVILEHMGMIENTAAAVAQDAPVQISLMTGYFPEITYGEMTFPEGEYEALRIEIGEAKGHNWWCVLYPGLCFDEVSRPVVTEQGKEQLNMVLEEEAYEWMLHPEKIRIRFRWF